MTNVEMSDTMDTLLNAYAQEAGYGQSSDKGSLALDEYEKSVFLTEAQEQLVISYYNGSNPAGESFEQTEEVRRYLSNIVKDTVLSPSNAPVKKLTSTSRFFELPGDLWFVVYESLVLKSYDCQNGNSLDIVPVTHDEYNRVKNNPYRGANGRRALRLDCGGNAIEVISTKEVSGYHVRYLRKPSPIVLVDLPERLSVNGTSKESPCELHEAVHHKIVELAVSLVIKSRVAGKE